MSFGFGFSLPAYEGYAAGFGASSFGSGASLALDFLNGNNTLDPRITFTRSTTATFTNSAGLIATAAINAPRFDYDPVTLAPKGLLIEEQRTNLLLRSEEFQTTWVNERSSDQVNVIVSPAGTLTGSKLVEDTTATATHLILQGISGLASGSTLTFTMYLKAAERISARLQINDGASLANTVSANFDVSTGVASATQSTGTFTGASSTITAVGNGWFRCSISGVATGVTGVQCRVLLVSGSSVTYTGDGVSGIYIYGAQLEAGAFATSYIPTVASQVTRAVDAAVMTGTNFSSWYNQAEGTLYGESSIPAINTSGVSIYASATISDGTINNFLNIRAFTTAGSLLWDATGRTNGVDQFDTGQQTYGTNVIVKNSLAYATNNVGNSVNGQAVSTDTSVILPIVNQLVIGGLTNNLNGHIRKIAYYLRRLANTELQAITS
jgi:hypothetical protein